MNIDPDVSRRGFLELSAGAMAALGAANPIPQQAGDGVQSQIGLADEVRGVAVLLGPEQNKPAPDSEYFDQWARGPYLIYVSSDTGARFRYDTDAEAWVGLPPCIVQKDNKLYFRKQV